MPKARNLIVAALVALVVLFLVLLANLILPGQQQGIAPVASIERAQQLASEGKRQQIVTFSDGMFALPEAARDGAILPARLFAIPVGQITLASPQTIGTSSNSDKDYGYRGFRQSWRDTGDAESLLVVGAFNNLIIYNKADGSLKKVFDKRIAVSAFKVSR